MPHSDRTTRSTSGLTLHAQPHQPASPILSFYTPSGVIVAHAQLMSEDPDSVGSYAALHAFMQQQQQLAHAAAEDQLYVKTVYGQQHLHSQQRHVHDLPAFFWFQVCVGAAGALTGAAIYAFSVDNKATRYYALTGLGYLIFAPSAAIYSTRPLFVDSDLFVLLSAINHFGAFFFVASLFCLLWHYPKPLRQWPISMYAYGVTAVLWIIDQQHYWAEMSDATISLLVLFLASMAVASIQGWLARRRPIDRASFRWFIVSIFLGTGIFAAVVMLPNALKMPPIASQGMMFGVFLLMYWGLALGLLRYRLFELETWWFSIWSWFLSGLSVVVIDVTLASFMSLSSQMSLVVSLALTGWLYFPIRQWLLHRLRRDAHQHMNQWLPIVLPLLLDMRLGSDQERQILKRWPQILMAVFSPLHMTRQHLAHSMAIGDAGQALYVPELSPSQASPTTPPQTFVLHHAARGQRLFNRQDIHTSQLLLQLAELALSVARARDTGARLERERIARDIHDDLGAKLLYLLQKSEPNQQIIVRETLDDLRYLLNSLDGEDITLDEALATWRVETSERALQQHTRLNWQAHIADDRSLTAFEYHHLTRMLREAITNVFKHSQPSHLSVDIFHPSPDFLGITIRNDGPHTHNNSGGGRGLQNMQRRAQSLHGHISWQRDHDYHLSIRVQLSDYDPYDLLTPSLETSP
jgi:signal transduction histidine kinase